VNTKPRERGGHSPHWVAEPEKLIIIIILIINIFKFIKKEYCWKDQGLNSGGAEVLPHMS
jgi:hypothetical protein